MKVRKPNQNEAKKTDNSITDYVVVEGITSPEELVERGKLTAQNTIDFLKQMYPKSPEKEARERELMLNKEFNKYLKEIENDNREKISTVYKAHDIKQKVINLKNELTNINEKIKKSNEVNLIYQKDAKIRELEELLKQATAK